MHYLNYLFLQNKVSEQKTFKFDITLNSVLINKSDMYAYLYR